MDPSAAAREHVLDAHRETVVAVLAGAEAAAARVEKPAARETVATALESALGEDVRASLVDLLRGAVGATGRELFADPVPASPYLVVTARGPLVRATLEDGRLVVLLRAFRRERGGYVHAATDPDAAVEVRFRRSP